MADSKVFVPPLKIQGIKTKLIPLIRETAALSGETTWIEPFMGSGVVGFNVAPRKAVFADANPHIINFYNHIREKKITAATAREFLEQEGAKLAELDGEYYYLVRERFNQRHDPLDFLFLNRSCFNGMIRFNKTLDFNVPYGHKPQRFSKAYITKIVNQISHIESRLRECDWTFMCCSFEETIALADEQSFVYCDPPYIGRHVDYYDSWDEASELALCRALRDGGADFMLSTWDHNEFRENQYITRIWNFCRKITQDHFYHVGAREQNRRPVVEALLVHSPRNQAAARNRAIAGQINLFDAAGARAELNEKEQCEVVR